MSFLKTIWGFFFRLFPCPTSTGLRRVGNPNRESPVLVTCNFDLTVKRLTRILERAGIDAWLLVADSKGVNVWCAAGGDEFNTHSVVSAVKTSGIADFVDHRSLILPPLGAPGISARDVRKETGWKTRWGPVRAEDLPAYLDGSRRREQQMRLVTYNWKERFDTAIGSLFPFYLLIGIGFLVVRPGLISDYLIATAAAFLLFFLLCPWIPGKTGLIKASVLDIALAGVLAIAYFAHGSWGSAVVAPLIITMVMVVVNGLELGGLASTMPSDLDPFLARLGLSAIGNVEFAGTIRTELLNGYRRLTYDPQKCNGCRSCYEVCPQGVWQMSEARRADLSRLDACTACRACLTQCTTGAIQAVPTGEGQAHEDAVAQRQRRHPLKGTSTGPPLNDTFKTLTRT